MTHISVIIYFFSLPNFFFLFLETKKKKKKKLHGAVLNGTVQVLLPCACRGREEEDFKSLFPAILLLSLSTPLAQKSRMTHTHTYTTIPCNSHATMPCTWTGYGEPLPRLPINTGKRTEPERGMIF